MSQSVLGLVRRYFEEVLDRGNISAVDEIMASDFTLRVPPSLVPEPLRGRDTFKQMVTGLRAAFPDLRFELHEAVADDARAMVSWTMRGTHSDVWLGVPATGAKVTLVGVDVFRVSDGRIAEVQIHGDYLGALRQLGALPS